MISIDIRMEPLGEPLEWGFWCPECLVSSSVRLRFMFVVGQTASLRTFEYCTDCRGSRWVPAGEA